MTATSGAPETMQARSNKADKPRRAPERPMTRLRMEALGPSPGYDRCSVENGRNLTRRAACVMWTLVQNYVYPSCGVRITAILLFCFFGAETALANMGALANYRGDWMINKNRKYLVATRWMENSDTLEMRYAYSTSNCFRWTRKTWFMRYDAVTHCYTATIQGRTTAHAIGEWDDATNTMTWTIVTKAGGGDATAKPHGARRIVHSFGDGEARWVNEYVGANGTTTSSRPMFLDILVPYSEPQPSHAPRCGECKPEPQQTF